MSYLKRHITREFSVILRNSGNNNIQNSDFLFFLVSLSCTKRIFMWFKSVFFSYQSKIIVYELKILRKIGVISEGLPVIHHSQKTSSNFYHIIYTDQFISFISFEITWLSYTIVFLVIYLKPMLLAKPYFCILSSWFTAWICYVNLKRHDFCLTFEEQYHSAVWPIGDIMDRVDERLARILLLERRSDAHLRLLPASYMSGNNFKLAFYVTRHVNMH